MTLTASAQPMAGPDDLGPARPPDPDGDDRPDRRATDRVPQRAGDGALRTALRTAVGTPQRGPAPLMVPAVLLASVTWSWWVNLSIEGPGAVLTAIGQWTGLAASVFALLTVALLARVPVVTRVLGTDTAVRWHRWVATLTMTLLPVHVVTTVLGYNAADPHGPVATFVDMLSGYPDILTATVATVLLTVISLSSIRAVRRRFSYQAWLFVHWYSYLAVALAFGHTISDGAAFQHSAVPALAWTWLHLFVAGLVLWYRLALPAWLMATHRLHVAAVLPESAGAVSLVIAGEHMDDYDVEAGHHVRLRFVTRDGWWQSHPLSLSAAPRHDRWRLTVAAMGDHTRWMQTVPVGTRVLVSGAHGHLTTRARRRDRVALIGGGIAITPLRALLEAFPAEVDVQVLYRAHAPEDLVLRQELDRLAAERQGRVQYLLGPRQPDPDRDWLSPAGLVHHVPDLAERDVYVAGMAGFVDRVCTSLRALGVPPAHIHTERYDP